MISQLNRVAHIAAIATLLNCGFATADDQAQQRITVMMIDDTPSIDFSDGTDYKYLEVVARSIEAGNAKPTTVTGVGVLSFDKYQEKSILICIDTTSNRHQAYIHLPSRTLFRQMVSLAKGMESATGILPQFLSREKFLAVAGEDKSTLPTIIRGGESRTDPMNDVSFGGDPMGADRRRDQLVADQVKNSLNVVPHSEQYSVRKLTLDGKGIAGVHQIEVGRTLQFEMVLTSAKSKHMSKLQSPIFQIRGLNGVIHRSGMVNYQAIVDGGDLVVRFKCELKQPVPAPTEIVLIDANRGVVGSVEYP